MDTMWKQQLSYGFFVSSLLIMVIFIGWDVSEKLRADRMNEIQEQRKQLVKDVCGKTDPTSELSLQNLIVDDAHGIIYCFVPKVACTNWKKFMFVLKTGEPYGYPGDVNVYVHGKGIFKFLQQSTKEEIKAKLKHYTKFLFVRDPFIRTISAYRHKFVRSSEKNIFYYQNYGKKMLRLYANMSNPPETYEEADAKGVRPSFKNFIQYLLDLRTTKDFDIHWRQISKLCEPCLLQYDFIGHQETMEEDAKHLLRILKLNDIKFPPSYVNVTTPDTLGNWFRDVSLEERKKLYEIYESDFKLFGYKKPDDLIEGLI